MNKRFPIFLSVIVILGGVSGAVYLTFGDREEVKKSSPAKIEEAPKEGFLAPQFALHDLKGSLVKLKDFEGKVVLLNFWATWCSPCRREIPSLEKLYQMRKDKGFEIVAVNAEVAPPSQIVSFAKKFEMSFPILLDSEGSVANDFWVRAIPTSFLLDKNGVIGWKIVGTREWNDPYVLNRIDQLLGE